MENRLELAKEYAKSRGGECLSTSYINNRTPLNWKCSNNNHKSWTGTYDIVTTKTWCPQCAGKFSKEERLLQAQEIAKQNGGQCLSDVYFNIKSHLKWKCHNENHNSWFASLDSIQRGSWCPQCGLLKISELKRNKNGLEIAKKHAESKGGKCLSTEYISCNKKLEWKCSNSDHKSWFATYTKVIHSGRWCPECSVYYYKEHIIRNLLEYLLESKFPKSKPIWNVNPKTKYLLELDGYSNELNIAFEFQGLHHYEIDVFYNNKEKLEYIKFKDETKKQNCIDNNVKLIIIDDNFEITKEDEIFNYLLYLLEDNNIKINKIINYDDIKKIFKTMINHQEIYYIKAQQYAESKGGKLLSESYKTNNTKMKWECSKGHQWLSNYSSVINNETWCPQCVNEELSLKYRNQNGLLEAQKHAESKDGKCLSTEYINANEKLKWKCNDITHNIWEATFSHVVKGGTWCPECAGYFSSQYQLDRAKEHAESKGGRCLSTKYINANEKLEWKCHNESHNSWFALFDSIQRGSWCPECAGKFSKEEGLLRAQKHAESKGGKCLSTEYTSCYEKLEWKCSNSNHQPWFVSFDKTLNSNQWCPECTKEKRRNETKLSDGLEIAKKHAISKGGQCLSEEYLSFHSLLKWKCHNENHKSWKANYNSVVRNGSWCPECAGHYSKEEGLLKAQEYALLKNGKCLSTEYINAHKKLNWECSKGHKWLAPYNIVFKNAWCPECAGKFSKEEGLLRAQKHAESKGGKCLSTEYINNSTKMKWQCHQNHNWEARYSNVVGVLNRWCPYCSGNKKII